MDLEVPNQLSYSLLLDLKVSGPILWVSELILWVIGVRRVGNGGAVARGGGAITRVAMARAS